MTEISTPLPPKPPAILGTLTAAEAQHLFDAEDGDPQAAAIRHNLGASALGEGEHAFAIIDDIDGAEPRYVNLAEHELGTKVRIGLEAEMGLPDIHVALKKIRAERQHDAAVQAPGFPEETAKPVADTVAERFMNQTKGAVRYEVVKASNLISGIEEKLTHVKDLDGSLNQAVYQAKAATMELTEMLNSPIGFDSSRFVYLRSLLDNFGSNYGSITTQRAITFEDLETGGNRAVTEVAQSTEEAHNYRGRYAKAVDESKEHEITSDVHTLVDINDGFIELEPKVAAMRNRIYRLTGAMPAEEEKSAGKVIEMPAAREIQDGVEEIRTYTSRLLTVGPAYAGAALEMVANFQAVLTRVEQAIQADSDRIAGVHVEIAKVKQVLQELADLTPDKE